MTDGKLRGESAIAGSLTPRVKYHLATHLGQCPRGFARIGGQELSVKTHGLVAGQDQAALNSREKVEPSTPTPRETSLSLQAGSVSGLEERGRIARGIELERCPVRVRSREKHPVRGPRQSAESRQVARDDTIQETKERNWGEAYVGAIFADCRPLRRC